MRFEQTVAEANIFDGPHRSESTVTLPDQSLLVVPALDLEGIIIVEKPLKVVEEFEDLEPAK